MNRFVALLFVVLVLVMMLSMALPVFAGGGCPPKAPQGSVWHLTWTTLDLTLDSYDRNDDDYVCVAGVAINETKDRIIVIDNNLPVLP